VACGLPLSGQLGPGDLLPPRLPRLSPRRPLVLLLQVALLAGVVGGTAAFVRMGKTSDITLRVDGQARQVRTHASTVGGVLAAAGVPVGSHDEIAPDPTAKIADHDTIVVRRGRLLTLTLDQHTRQVWVTATSVDEALAQLGLVRPVEYVSASRSRPIGLDGASLIVRFPQRVQLVADGKARTLFTTRATVGEFLADNRVALGPKDLLSTPASSYPADGLVERITRVSDTEAVASQIIARSTRQVADSSLYVGSTRVLDDGQDGVLQLVFAIHLKNGKQTGRSLKSQTETTPMRPRLVAVGTKPVPPPPPPPPPAPVAVSYSGSGQGLNWGALANCESGGNPRAVSPGGAYRGLYQFSFGTWHSVGGAGDPIDASASEQTYRAQILYGQAGRSSWPVCGQYL
jgi:uncharacterized protein YabE (DUF348 family)